MSVLSAGEKRDAWANATRSAGLAEGNEARALSVGSGMRDRSRFQRRFVAREREPWRISVLSR